MNQRATHGRHEGRTSEALETGVHEVQPSMKGTAFRSTLAAIERLHGAAGLKAVLAHLDDDARAALEHVLPVAWYPVSLSAALHESVRQVLHSQLWEGSRHLGREAARIDYTGVYRAVLRSIGFDTLFARQELAWKTYCTQGRFVWEQRGASAVRVWIVGVRGFNLGIWLACAGRAEALLTMSGAKTALVDIVDVRPDACTFDATWTT